MKLEIKDCESRIKVSRLTTNIKKNKLIANEFGISLSNETIKEKKERTSK